jgi:predicted ATPase
VRGFKNLHDVEIRFGPVTCIAGANGVGKSNLFDAIHFLHLLTTNQIVEAAQKVRDTAGRSVDPGALFTAFGSYQAREMRFTADLIVDGNVQDDFGVKAKAAITSLRYEVAFALDTQDGGPRLQLVHESLVPIRLRGKTNQGLHLHDSDQRESGDHRPPGRTWREKAASDELFPHGHRWTGVE